MKDYVIVKKSVFKALVDEIKRKAGISGKIRFKNVANTLSNIDVVDDENPIHISTFSTNSEYGDVTPSFSGKAGEVVTITATEKNGGVFEGWTDGVSTASRDITLSQSESYTAIFNKYVNLTVTVARGYSVRGKAVGTGRYKYGSTATMSVIPKNAGGYDSVYIFQRWSDGSTENPRTVTLTSDKTYTAYIGESTIAKIAYFDVTSYDKNTGTVTGSAQCPPGTVKTIIATPKSGYVFDKWSDGDESSTRTITVNNSTALVAFFKKLKYDIVANVKESHESRGSVSGTGTYEIGSDAVISAIPNNGFTFVKWNDGNTDNPRTISVSENKTFTAEFSEPIQTYDAVISVYNNQRTMGRVSGSGTYIKDSSIQISAIPNNGFSFKRWSDENIDNPRTITISGTTKLKAYFDSIPNHYSLQIASVDESMGSVSSSGVYKSGTEVTFSATSKDGYKFDRWNDGDTNISRTITLYGNKFFIAYFSSIDSE